VPTFEIPNIREIAAEFCGGADGRKSITVSGLPGDESGFTPAGLSDLAKILSDMAITAKQNQIKKLVRSFEPMKRYVNNGKPSVYQKKMPVKVSLTVLDNQCLPFIEDEIEADVYYTHHISFLSVNGRAVYSSE